MSHLKKVDHITYACEQGAIERWAWFHIEVEGGTLINRIDDVRPDDPDSSMKIWCIDYGDFGVALIEGIDRAKKSQVTKFVEAHGDHACQHVAYDTYDLDAFVEPSAAHGRHAAGPGARAQRRLRRPQADVRPRLRTRATPPRTASRSTASDRGSRTRDAVAITFAEETGKGFYDQIEEAVAAARRGAVLRLLEDARRLGGAGSRPKGR